MNRVGIWVVAATAFLGLVASAQAGVITSGGFPTAGDPYFSATNGSGTIPLGGQSAFMWTTGDNVQTASASVAGSYLATSLTDTFTIDNFLGGSSLTVDALLNGINVGSWTANGCGFCGTDQQIIFNASFAPIPLSGAFTVEYILADTIPNGDGSIAFLDGGQGSISGTAAAVPEPFTLSLFGAGLAGAAAMRRRRKSKQV